jgi:hypothetical protein
VADVWYADGLRFECTRCGGCCRGEPGYVWVRDHEILGIARFLDMTLDDFMAQFVRRVFDDYSLIELPNGDCIFWAAEGCRIYPVRPTQCRTWPFWPTNLTSEHAWSMAGLRCPGVNRGKVFPCHEIEARREATRK